MKNKILLIFFLVVSIKCFAQEMNIYLETFERFTELLDTIYKEKLDKIYMEETNGITDCFPAIIGSYEVQVLNSKVKKEILENEGKIYMYRMKPLIFQNGLFYIEIIGFSYRIDGTGIVNAGYRYIYNYDCQKQRLNFVKVEGGGI